MKLDPSILARIQFAFTVSFHIIFPTMSILVSYDPVSGARGQVNVSYARKRTAHANGMF